MKTHPDSRVKTYKTRISQLMFVAKKFDMVETTKISLIHHSSMQQFTITFASGQSMGCYRGSLSLSQFKQDVYSPNPAVVIPVI